MKRLAQHGTNVFGVKSPWHIIAACGWACQALIGFALVLAEPVFSGDEAAETRTIRTISEQAKDPTSSEARGNRVALVIGNSKYRTLSPLTNPGRDATDICAVLRVLAFDVACVYDLPTRRELREAVRSFVANLRPGTAAFFYYAGHGVQLKGENYLLPTDMDAQSPADVEDEGLSLAYLLRAFEEARSAPNIVIVDACRDNPFPSTGRILAATGLARVDPPVGTVLVYATAPNAVAIDGRPGIDKNGLFAKHLIARLPEPGIKIDELLQLVSKAVEDEARASFKREQVPYRSSSFSGAFCIAGCDDPQLAERLNQINKQTEDAAKRVRELTEENTKLRTQAGQRGAVISNLEARELELTELRGKVSDLQKQAQNIEEFRKRIQQLQEDNEEQARIIKKKAQDDRTKPAKPKAGDVMIPIF